MKYFDTYKALVVIPQKQVGQLQFSDPVQPYLVVKKKVIYTNL